MIGNKDPARSSHGGERKKKTKIKISYEKDIHGFILFLFFYLRILALKND